MQRHGTFSSSAIWKLTTKGKKAGEFGKPALTYIEETVMEMLLGRQLGNESNAKETTWGTFVEQRCFDLLGAEYSLVSQERLVHETIKYWTGAPDLVTKDSVCDIKCPYTLKSFCTMADIIMSENVDTFKEEYPEYYWQLVSNAILTKKEFAEIIIYVPYQSELTEIREAANNYDGDQNNVAFLNWVTDDQLPYLIQGNFYNNMYKLKFPILIEDVEILTDCVERAIVLAADKTDLIKKEKA